MNFRTLTKRIGDQALSLCYSENPWGVLRSHLPLTVIFLSFWVMSPEALSLPLGLALYVIGVFAWTLAEYLIHRYFFHWTPKSPKVRKWVHRIHVDHHLRPEEETILNAGPLFAGPIALVFFALFWLTLTALGLREPAALGGVFLSGVVLGHWVYEWVHYLCHVKKARKPPTGPWISGLRRYHSLHHFADWKSRYGVTTSFWDRVFGTYGKVSEGARVPGTFSRSR